ncbi:conserved hypothetical protein [Paecilomyces variotii No. 5]|uniref:Uncharacterized protein n=1 Tax=Byssochlamys spectabilis (strain No. 5 / NBRC 109023) TaxID=1356009 RepID=V5FX09_BYSSN|nr:conserved hypothetical protein [Paecilomyces variotii No. 5]
MPSSKTETAIRFPESDDQKRRIRNTTQDRKAVDRMKAEASSSQNRSADAQSWSVDQLLDTSMDASGNPVPDPASYHDGNRARKAKGEEDQDIYDAMTAD